MGEGKCWHQPASILLPSWRQKCQCIEWLLWELSNKHKLLLENAYLLQIQSQSVVPLDGWGLHKRSRLFHAYSYQHLLPSGPVQFRFSWLSRLPIALQSNRCNQLARQIAKFGRPLDYQDRNSSYGQSACVGGYPCSAPRQPWFQHPQHPCSRQEVPLGKTSRSHWYWHFARSQSEQRLVRKFLSLYSIQRGLQVRWLFQSSLIVTSENKGLLLVVIRRCFKCCCGLIDRFFGILRTNQLQTNWQSLGKACRNRNPW